MSRTVEVTVDVDIDEVLADLSDQDLLDECKNRGLTGSHLDGEEQIDDGPLLERSYNELRHGQIGEATRDLIYQRLGRIL